LVAPAQAPAPAHVPIGREPDATPPITCPSGNAPEQVAVGCEHPDQDPKDPKSITLDRDPRAVCNFPTAIACHINLSGPAGSPPGSIASFCRDADGTISGAIRLIAPDASIITEGACEQSLAIGAWLSWADGHLAWAGAYEHGVKRGVEIEVNRFDHRAINAGDLPAAVDHKRTLGDALDAWLRSIKDQRSHDEYESRQVQCSVRYGRGRITFAQMIRVARPVARSQRPSCAAGDRGRTVCRAPVATAQSSRRPRSEANLRS